MEQSESVVRSAAPDETPDRRSPEDQVVQAYINILSRLGTARTMAVEYADEGALVWTVIDVEPEDREARGRIYEAELLASDAAPDANVSFRLVNRRDYTPEALGQLLPPGAPVSQRKAAAS